MFANPIPALPGMIICREAQSHHHKQQQEDSLGVVIQTREVLVVLAAFFLLRKREEAEEVREKIRVRGGKEVFVNLFFLLPLICLPNMEMLLQEQRKEN